MKKYIYIFAILLISLTSGLYAKGSLQAANWCFGNQGQITFKNGYPEELGPSSITTNEGVATISDDNGNLLFYTDGRSVWNKNHLQMPNGWGLFGHSSSSQSGVIVPYPGNNNLFYVFTVNDIWSTRDSKKGFSYSIVDLTADDGFGDVTQKNISLFSPSCEKITAVGTYDGKGIWVLGQRWRDNKIVVFLVDKNGIQLHGEYPIKALCKYDNPAWTKGCMKFSQKGDLLAVANNGVSLALYDFNVKTGVVSNERYSTIYKLRNAYGVEFSPNSNYLYVSSTPYGDNESFDRMDTCFLLQIDLIKAKTNPIEKSLKILGLYNYTWYDTDAYMGSLQLALDKKIYLATCQQTYNSPIPKNYLSVINSPDRDNCNYVFQGLSLNNYSVYLGLPTFIQSFFRPDINNFVTTDFCDGEDVYMHSDYFKGIKYKWTGPNGFATDTCDTVIIKPDRSFSGTYKLFTTDTFGFTDTAVYEIRFHKTDISTKLIDTIPNKYVSGNYEKTLILTNNEPESAMVDSFYLISGNKYTLINGGAPFEIFPNEVRKYKIQVDSRSPGNFKDTIVLSINAPCPYYEKIPLADSLARVALHIVLPDTTVNLGEVFTSEIKAYLEPKTGMTFTFDLNFTYSYLSYIYNTTKYQLYPYTKTISDNKELYSLSFPQLVMNDSISILTKVRGITLLAREYMTPLEFTNGTISESGLDLVLHNGKIQVSREDCTKDLFQIQGTNIHVAFSQPAPLTEGGKIELFSPDKGPLKLTIYTAMGNKVQEMDFNSNGAFGREIDLDLNNYSSGLYTLVWESSINTFRKTIIIQK